MFCFGNKLHNSVIDGMFTSSQNSYVEALTPRVMISEGAAFEK